MFSGTKYREYLTILLNRTYLKVETVFLEKIKHFFIANCVHVIGRVHTLHFRSLLYKWTFCPTYLLLALPNHFIERSRVPADCVPRCRHGRTCVFRLFLRLCGRATHALQFQGEMPDKAGHRGFTPCADGRGSLPGRACSPDVPMQEN